MKIRLWGCLMKNLLPLPNEKTLFLPVHGMLNGLKEGIVKSALALGLMLAALATQAQVTTQNQHLLWSRYYLHLNVGKVVQLRQEVEERNYWFPWRQHQLLVRTHVAQKLGKGWNTAAGFTYFIQTQPQDAFADTLYNETELRPQLELANKHEINEVLSIGNRYWAEFRFFEKSDGGFRYSHIRFRYNLELSIRVHDKVSLKVFDEIHINAGKPIVNNIFDQNRVGGGLLWQPIKPLGLELGYFNWYQQLASGSGRVSRHIVRFTIHHTITVKQRKKATETAAP